MSATTTLVIKSGSHSGQTVSNELFPSTDKHTVVNNLTKLLSAVVCGSHDARIEVSVGEGNTTKASENITVDQSEAVADDTVTIGGVVLTAKASGAVANQFNIGASDAALATNLAAAINAQASLSQVMTATAAAAVVTITYNFDGIAGNLVTLATSNATAFALGSGALNGATSTSVKTPLTYSFGLA